MKVKANYTQVGDVKKTTDMHSGSLVPASGGPTCQCLRTSLNGCLPQSLDAGGGAPHSSVLKLCR